MAVRLCSVLRLGVLSRNIHLEPHVSHLHIPDLPGKVAAGLETGMGALEDKLRSSSQVHHLRRRSEGQVDRAHRTVLLCCLGLDDNFLKYFSGPSIPMQFLTECSARGDHF